MRRSPPFTLPNLPMLHRDDTKLRMHMKHIRNLLACLLSLAATLHAVEPAPRLNVLFIMADDLRTSVGCYGDTQAKTPNIDRLAARGVRFDRAYVQYPVCNPSRTSMLTSTRPEVNGVVHNDVFFRRKLADVVTLPQLFRESGGHAVSYGKIFHAGLVEGEIENPMLDIGKSWDDARMFRPTKKGGEGRRRNLTGDVLKWCVVGDMEGDDDDQSDGQTAVQAMDAMQRLGDKPWFIAAGFHRPHDPFVVNKKYAAMFPPGSLKLNRDPADASPLLRHSIGGRNFTDQFAKWTDDDRMDFMSHYYAGATQTDAQVGRLMDTMDRLHLWDKTIVVFVGDHGYHLGEHGWWTKFTLFELCCRAPFIVAAPGVKPAVCRSLVEFLDIYPTVADLCGLKIPATVKGTTLRPLLDDPGKSVHECAITYNVRNENVTGYSLRTDRWHLIEWNEGREGSELYDRESDAGEYHNLATDPAHVATVEELSTLLHRERKKTGSMQ